MKFPTLLFSIILCTVVTALAQKKPPLPTDHFEKYTFTFSKNLNVNDPATIREEIKNIAAGIQMYTRSALEKYTVEDSATLLALQNNLAYTYLCLGQFSQARESIKLSRKIAPAPAYTLPFGLFPDAYAKAAIANPDTQKPAFTKAFEQAIRENLDALPADFKNDIVNSSKGKYSSKLPEVNEKQVRRTLEQSLERTNGVIKYYNAVLLLTAYSDLALFGKTWQTVEKVLYEISPAKVEEAVVKIPMRDGIKLNALVYRNVASQERVPAIVSLSPYPSGLEALKGNVFATNGYCYVYVDNRGRRDSEGEFFPYEKDAQDFHDIIDWVSKQAWCNGSVATSGGSYLGFTQWQAIRQSYKHPALKAINPMVAVGFGVDFPRNFNAPYSYILQWASLVSGKENNTALFSDYKFWNSVNYNLYKNRIPFARLDSVAALPNPFFKKWVNHPDFDNYWRDILPNRADYEALDIPVFTITGYYDADQNGAMYYYNNHMRYGNEAAKNKHYILIGPYDHGGSQWQPRATQAGLEIEKQAQVPIYKYVIQWFDWVLKGKTKPAFIQDNVNYFATGTGQWKSTKSFNTIAKDTLRFYLTNATTPNKKRKTVYTLSTQQPATQQVISYKHDVASVLDSTFLYSYAKPFDDSLYLADTHNIVFETPAFPKDIMITGKILPRLYMSLNVPDADFGIHIHEISADGKSTELCASNIRARYRHSDENPQLVKPGTIDRYDFTGNFLYIKKISKGSKLRITFEVVNDPNYEKNYGFGGVVSQESTKQPRIIEATIQLSKKYPSRIDIPYTEIQTPSSGKAATKQTR